MADVAKLMSVLIASLMITSCLISFFAMNVYGYSILPFSTLNIGLNSASSSANFVSSCNLTPYVTSGSWSCGTNGATLSGSGALKVPLASDKHDGVYRNSYHVVSSAGDYYIILGDTEYSSYYYMRVTDDGLHFPALITPKFLGGIELYDYAFIPIPNANQYTDVDISTDYNINDRTLTVNFAGSSYSIDSNKMPVMIPTDIVTAQGIGSNVGVTISSMSGNFNPTSTTMDGLNMIFSFISNVLAIIVWNIDASIFPWQLNLLFIKTQAIGIFICLIALIRG